MLRLIAATTAVAMLAIAAPAGAAELISNGGFESGLTGWSSSGQVNVNTAADYGPCCGTTGSAPAYANNHFVDFGSGNIAGTDLLSQPFATVVGATYTFSFDAGAFGSGTNQLVASVGGVSNTYTLTANNNADTTFGLHSFTFLGTGSDSVSFSVTTNNSDNTDALIDNVSVQGLRAGVPEPATWAMMLVGFFGLGGALRRRRLVLA